MSIYRSAAERSASGMPPGATNYITARGAKRLRDELQKLRAANVNSERIIGLWRQTQRQLFKKSLPIRARRRNFFSKSISSAKRFAWKVPVISLAQYRAVSALTCSPTATGIFESKS